jgi:hypothetical protein
MTQACCRVLPEHWCPPAEQSSLYEFASSAGPGRDGRNLRRSKAMGLLEDQKIPRVRQTSMSHFTHDKTEAGCLLTSMGPIFIYWSQLRTIPHKMASQSRHSCFTKRQQGLSISLLTWKRERTTTEGIRTYQGARSQHPPGISLPRLILCFSPERIPGVSMTLMLSSTALGSWAHTNLHGKEGHGEPLVHFPWLSHTTPFTSLSHVCLSVALGWRVPGHPVWAYLVWDVSDSRSGY